MSGGHWGYQQHEFDEVADNNLVTESLKLLGQIEHELDWGICGDSCKACANLRVIAGLEMFYDHQGHAVRALEILRDRSILEHRCTKCLTDDVTYNREGAMESAAEITRRAPRGH